MRVSRRTQSKIRSTTDRFWRVRVKVHVEVANGERVSEEDHKSSRHHGREQCSAHRKVSDGAHNRPPQQSLGAATATFAVVHCLMAKVETKVL